MNKENHILKMYYLIINISSNHKIFQLYAKSPKKQCKYSNSFLIKLLILNKNNTVIVCS